MPPGGILTLDLSSRVGWCYGLPDGVPVFGTWRLQPKTKLLAAKFAAFEQELQAAIERFRPTLIVKEAPLPSGIGRTNTNTARQQFGLSAYTDGKAHQAGIPCREVHAQTARKAVTGKGSYGSTVANKRASIAWCIAQGWHVLDDNAADGCVLWRYACNHLVGGL